MQKKSKLLWEIDMTSHEALMTLRMMKLRVSNTERDQLALDFAIRSIEGVEKTLAELENNWMAEKYQKMSGYDTEEEIFDLLLQNALGREDYR